MAALTDKAILNREETLALLRAHVAALAGYLAPGNSSYRRIMLSGTGPAAFGSLTRINELVAMLPDEPPYVDNGGE